MTGLLFSLTSFSYDYSIVFCPTTLRNEMTLSILIKIVDNSWLGNILYFLFFTLFSYSKNVFLFESPKLQTLFNSFPQFEACKLNVVTISSVSIDWACSYWVEPWAQKYNWNLQSDHHGHSLAVHGHSVGPSVMDGQDVAILRGRQLYIPCLKETYFMIFLKINIYLTW